MKSIGALIHSVALHARVLSANRMMSSGKLTVEQIDALRKKMSALAEQSDAHKNRSALPPLSDEDFEKQIMKQVVEEENEFKKQAAREELARTVFESVKKKEK